MAETRMTISVTLTHVLDGATVTKTASITMDEALTEVIPSNVVSELMKGLKQEPKCQ